MQRPVRLVAPLFITYFVISAASFAFWRLMENNGIDVAVVRLANTLLLLISLGSFFMQYRALKNPNPHAFVRGVMTSLLLKMLAVAGAVVIYHLVDKAHFNKKAVFVSLLLYLVYLAVEGNTLSRLNRKKNA